MGLTISASVAVRKHRVLGATTRGEPFPTRSRRYASATDQLPARNKRGDRDFLSGNVSNVLARKSGSAERAGSLESIRRTGAASYVARLLGALFGKPFGSYSISCRIAAVVVDDVVIVVVVVVVEARRKKNRWKKDQSRLEHVIRASTVIEWNLTRSLRASVATKQYYEMEQFYRQ